MASHAERNYTNIYNSGSSRVHLGDTHNCYGASPDEQAFRSVLDSLRYDGMDDRRDRLNSAERGTFEWALTKEDVETVTDRSVRNDFDDHTSIKIFDASFTSWFESYDDNLFCFMGKPGSGKSTLMYVQDASEPSNDSQLTQVNPIGHF
jgi:hypothetical protein